MRGVEEIIDEAKNSKLDLKSFLVGEAVQNEYEQQLDQLKAENDELKRQHQADKGLITSTGKMNYQLLQEYDKLKTALIDIKEIAEENCKLCFSVDGFKKPEDCGICEYARILQKISECEDNQ